MSNYKVRKVSSLPSPLEADTVYYVKGVSETVFQIYVTNNTGTIVATPLGAVTGTATSGQVAFWNSTSSITGDNGLTWDNTNKRLTITDGTGTGTLELLRLNRTGSGFRTSYLATYSNDIEITRFGNVLADDEARVESVRNVTSSRVGFYTAGTERWRITSTGILQSNGAQTIQTSTGNLTLATGGGNGDIILSPNGTGLVSAISQILQVNSNQSESQIRIINNGFNKRIFTRSSDRNFGIYNDETGEARTQFRIITGIGSSNDVMRLLEAGGNILIGTTTDSGDRLRVNGTVRIDSITNATGDFVTVDANNVLRRRTATEVRTDIGAFPSSSLSIASGQVAFGTGVNTVGGDSGLLWNNTDKTFSIFGSASNPTSALVLNTRKNAFTTSSGFSEIFTTNDGGTGVFSLFGNLVIQSRANLARSIFFATNISGTVDWRWSINAISNGALESNGSQTIRTSTGNLTIATAGGNGNILLTPNGTGSILSGTVENRLWPFGNFAGTPTQQLFLLRQGGGLIGFNGASNESYLNFGLVNDLGSPDTVATIATVNVSTSNNAERSDLAFYTKPSTLSTGVQERMRITSGGNVLIGTTTDSGDKLRVNGTVRLDSITNATGDFVTVDANNVLRRRTADEVRSDINIFADNESITSAGFNNVITPTSNTEYAYTFSSFDRSAPVGTTYEFEFAAEIVWQNATTINDFRAVINITSNLQTLLALVPTALAFPNYYVFKVTVTRTNDAWVQAYTCEGGSSQIDARILNSINTSTTYTGSLTPKLGLKTPTSAFTTGDLIRFLYMNKKRIK